MTHRSPTTRAAILTAYAAFIFSLAGTPYAIAADEEPAASPQTAPPPQQDTTAAATPDSGECLEANPPTDDKTLAMGPQSGMGAGGAAGNNMTNSRMGGIGPCAAGTMPPGSSAGLPTQQPLQMRSQTQMRTPGTQQGQAQGQMPAPTQTPTQQRLQADAP